MKTKIIALIAAAAISMGMVAMPAHAVKNTGGEFNNVYAGLGAKGYDVVSYFTDHKAMSGNDKITYEYGGVKWEFVSDEHREMFKKDPLKYAPQYGGFCSWGVSVGKLFDVDPKDGWTIADGKLYLNFNSDINKTFAGDTKGFTAKADSNWANLNK